MIDTLKPRYRVVQMYRPDANKWEIDSLGLNLLAYMGYNIVHNDCGIFIYWIV